MKGLNEVKKDLRELKKYTHAIKQLEATERTHRARIKLLESMERNTRICALIEREQALLSALQPDSIIEKVCELEEKYMSAINTLPLVDKGIIVDAFINGTPYWKIGLQVGYSEEGVRKHINALIRELAGKV